MHKIDDNSMERYKKILSQSPDSQAFAPLAEGFRERGSLQEAEKIVKNGIQRHPKFAGGLLVFAKILKDQKKYGEARQHLEKVIQLDSANLLAYQILGDLCLLQNEPKGALKYYKMVLFFNPESTKAQKVIQKLESLTADEYDEEVFSMAPLQTMPTEKMSLVPAGAPPQVPLQTPGKWPQGLQRMLSLVDAFVVRNDLSKAQFLLTETEVEFGEHPEIQHRRKLLYNRQSSQLSREDDEVENLRPILTRETAIRDRKLALLKSVLRVIERSQI